MKRGPIILGRRLNVFCSPSVLYLTGLTILHCDLNKTTGDCIEDADLVETEEIRIVPENESLRKPALGRCTLPTLNRTRV